MSRLLSRKVKRHFDNVANPQSVFILLMLGDILVIAVAIILRIFGANPSEEMHMSLRVRHRHVNDCRLFNPCFAE